MPPCLLMSPIARLLPGLSSPTALVRATSPASSPSMCGHCFSATRIFAGHVRLAAAVPVTLVLSNAVPRAAMLKLGSAKRLMFGSLLCGKRIRGAVVAARRG
jgi:hypothetical protein